MKKLVFLLATILALASAEWSQAGGRRAIRSRVIIPPVVEVQRIRVRAPVFAFREQVFVEEFRQPVRAGFRQRVELVDDYDVGVVEQVRVRAVRSRVCH